MSPDSSRKKTCQFCGESIQATAVKCRYCGEFLDRRDQDIVEATIVPQEGEAGSPSTRGNVFHEADVDTEMLWEGRPSLAALVGPFFKAGALLAVAWLVITYPLDGIALFDGIVRAPEVQRVLGYRGYIGIGLAALVILDLLWKILKLRHISYKMTNDRIESAYGVLSRQLDNLDLSRVTDQRLRQTLLDRLLGIGTVTVFTTDKTSPALLFYKVRKPRRVYDILKRASLIADRRRGHTHGVGRS